MTATKIAELNDHLRRTFTCGRVLMTAAVAALDSAYTIKWCRFLKIGFVPYSFTQSGAKIARILMGFPPGGISEVIARLLRDRRPRRIGLRRCARRNAGRKAKACRR